MEKDNKLTMQDRMNISKKYNVIITEKNEPNMKLFAQAVLNYLDDIDI